MHEQAKKSGRQVVNMKLMEKGGDGPECPYVSAWLKCEGQRGVAKWEGDKNMASDCKRNALWEPRRKGANGNKGWALCSGINSFIAMEP